MKRKHFILTVIAVCVVALIAEAVLLIKTFSKKDKKNPVENVISPTGEPVTPIPVAGRKVKKVTYESESEFGYFATMEFEYDEFGRETEARTYRKGELSKTEVTFYGKNGMRRETWIPDRNGELSEMMFADAVGETVSVSMEEHGEYNPMYWIEDGYMVRLQYNTKMKNNYRSHIIDWEYRDGYLSERTETEKEGNTETKHTRKKYTYDDAGRVIKIREYRSEKGEEETLYSTTEITYDGQRRTEILSENDTITEKVFLDGSLESKKVTFSNGSETEYRYFLPDDFKELLRTNFGTPYGKPYYTSLGSHGEDEIYDENHRVTTAFSDVVLAGNYYSVYRYSYDEKGKIDEFLVETHVSPETIVSTTEYHYQYDEFGNVGRVTVVEQGKGTIAEAVIEWISVPGVAE